MTKATLFVTLPNGEKAKRTTARNYTHVVCEHDKAVSWASSLKLAEQAKRQIISWHKRIYEGERGPKPAFVERAPLTIVPID